MRAFILPPFVAAIICAAPFIVVAHASDTDIDRAIADTPGLAATVRLDPDRELQIRAELARVSAQGQEALLRESGRLGRQLAFEAVPRMIVYAPDSSVLALLRAKLAALDEVAALGSDHCHTFLTRGMDSAEMPGLTPEVRRGLIEAVTRIAADAGGSDRQRLLPGEESESTLRAVMTRTYERAGDDPIDFEALADPASIEGDDARTVVCRTAVHFYRAVMELPPPDAAVLFRTLVAGR